MERIEFIMFKKYALMFLVSMVPLIELRGSIPIGLGMGLNPLWLYIICIVGNMLPVPFIFFFARKVLVWGSDCLLYTSPSPRDTR